QRYTGLTSFSGPPSVHGTSKLTGATALLSEGGGVCRGDAGGVDVDGGSVEVGDRLHEPVVHAVSDSVPVLHTQAGLDADVQVGLEPVPDPPSAAPVDGHDTFDVGRDCLDAVQRAVVHTVHQPADD